MPLTNALQWGRVCEDAEINPIILLAHSMPMLQWGRVCEDAEMRSWMAADGETGRLQWGRVCEDAEIVRGNILGHIAALASMGPRL